MNALEVVEVLTLPSADESAQETFVRDLADVHLFWNEEKMRRSVRLFVVGIIIIVLIAIIVAVGVTCETIHYRNGSQEAILHEFPLQRRCNYRTISSSFLESDHPHQQRQHQTLPCLLRDLRSDLRHSPTLDDHLTIFRIET